MGIFSFPQLLPGLAFLLPLLLPVLAFPLPPDILTTISPALSEDGRAKASDETYGRRDQRDPHGCAHD
jgi:hypothetical protein